MTIVLFFLNPARAAQEKPAPSVYSPEFCEFSVTFPEAPYKTERCEDEGRKECYDMVSYTQVYDLSSTVSFKVICTPVGEGLRDKYSGEIMQGTLKAMTKEKVLKTFDTSFRQEEGYKQAGLVGEGQMGRTPTIYIAQLWIGAKSALSVEAELTGENDEKADTLFSDILKSVHYKAEKKDKEQPTAPVAQKKQPSQASPETQKQEPPFNPSDKAAP